MELLRNIPRLINRITVTEYSKLILPNNGALGSGPGPPAQPTEGYCPDPAGGYGLPKFDAPKGI